MTRITVVNINNQGQEVKNLKKYKIKYKGNEKLYEYISKVVLKDGKSTK